MTRLALIRHGHTHWNREGRIQGRTDIPLDEDAARDLAKLELPSDWQQADTWSSPLKRAAQTATLISGRVPATTPALIEMDWGDWEGKHGKVLRADPASGFRDIEDWGWDYHPKNGESPAEVWDRVAPWIDQLASDAVAVCHIGIMRVILARATGWQFDGPAPFQIKRNRLYVVELGSQLAFREPPIRLPVRDQE